MRKLTKIIWVLYGLLLILPGFAYQLRPMNLGDTSYFDGLNFPTLNGWYFLLTAENYQADTFMDSSGQPIAGLSGPSLNTTVLLPQLIYETVSKPIFNAHLGLDALQPVLVNIDLEQPNFLGLTDNGTGAGDLMAGPFLQWDTVIKNGKPLFGTRIELDTFFPTGKYSVTDRINPGTNTYSFEPYWSATVFFTPQWELSWRWHYMYNWENPANQVTAGQATHINFATSYAINQRFNPGISGYYLKQLTDSQQNGVAIPNSKEQVLGIGPGFAYIINKKCSITANYYFESEVINRSKGNRVSALIAYYLD